MNSYKDKNNFSVFGAIFQIKLLQALVLDQQFFEKIYDILLTEYFDQEAHSIIYKIILDYYEKYKFTPSVENLDIAVKSISDHLSREMCSSILEDMKKNSVSDLKYIKDEALKFCRNQKMKKALLRAVDHLQRGEFDEIYKLVKDALDAGENYDIGHNYFEHFDRRILLLNRSTISTGWPVLDNILNGGYGKGELAIILAGTSIGKSWILTYSGKGALEQGKTVLHYTFELYEHQVGARYDAIISGIPINQINANKELVKTRLAEYSERTKGKLIIKNYPTKTANIVTIRNHINKLNHYGILPDIIIVDYADLMNSRKNYEQKRYELESIYEDLRALGGELQIPILSACFHGDTEIKLVDGRSIKIKDAILLSENEKLYVYSYDMENKKLVMGEVNKVYKSGTNQKLFKVTLDNDRYAIATENHKFMLRNSEYRELKDLKIGDSLMPLYEKINEDNRKLIYDNNGSYELNYRFVAKNKYGNIPKFYQIHHIDHDKANDHPDNLQLLTISEHFRIHGEKSWDYNNPCGLDRLRESYSERMKKYNPMFDKEIIAKMSVSRKGKCCGDDNPMRKEEVANKVSKSLKKSEKFQKVIRSEERINKFKESWKNKTKEEIKVISDKTAVAIYGSTRQDRIKQHGQAASESDTIEEYGEKTKFIPLRSSTKFNIWKQSGKYVRKKVKFTKERCKKISISRIKRKEELGYINALETCKKISIGCKAANKDPEKRYKFLKSYIDRGYKLRENTLLEFNELKIILNKLNHKVKSIEFYGYDDVYNIEVDKYHNYALSCGIIVKNSQTHRAGMDDEIVTLSSIAESFAKAQVADVIISLSRRFEDKRLNKGRLFIAKNRAGQDGIVLPVIMNTTTAKIDVLEPEDVDPMIEFADKLIQEELLKKRYKQYNNDKK